MAGRRLRRRRLGRFSPMTSPFDSSAFDAASAPMFDEPVSVTGVRAGVTRRQTLAVAVFDDASVDPMSDGALDSEVEAIRCVARSGDWRYIRDCMVRGDTVRRTDGRIYQITKITHDNAMGWIFTARRTK